MVDDVPVRWERFDGPFVPLVADDADKRAAEVLRPVFKYTRAELTVDSLGFAIGAVAAAIRAAVEAERERCAQLAEAEGPCCYGQQCHEAAAARIRAGVTPG